MKSCNWPDCEIGTCSCRAKADRGVRIGTWIVGAAVVVIAIGLLLAVARACDVVVPAVIPVAVGF